MPEGWYLLAERILVVADIHGHHEALVSLLRQANYRPGVDLLVLLGDYIDRGPRGVEVVAMVRELVAAGAVALKGNHEQMLLDYLTGELEENVYLWNGGGPTLAGYRRAGREVLLSDVSWMEGLPLYYEHEPYVFVHAGLRPGRALADQSPDDLLWIREEFYAFPTGLADRTVIFGHTPTVFFTGSPEVWFAGDKIAVDTGAAYGFFLTLLELPDGRTWRVPTGTAYRV